MTAQGLAPAAVAPSPEERQTALPGARHALILLLIINLFNYLDRMVLSSCLTPIQKELFPEGGAHIKALMGLLSPAFIVSYMLLAPVFGWVADRWSRWRLVGIAVILWSVASGASGLAATFVILLVTRCFVGVGEAAYGPVAPTLISDLYPVKIRGKVLSWFFAAIPVGSALGYVWGGTIAAAIDWHWAFYLVLPPGLLLGGWCFFMREPPRGQADLDEAGALRRAGLKDYLVLLRTPSYVLDTLGMTAMTFALGGIGYWMPDYLVDYRDRPAVATSIFGGIVVVAGLVATLLGGMVGDRLRPRFPGSYFLISGIAMLVAFPLFLCVLYTPFPYAWVFMFLACFCLFFNTGPTNTILANVTHPAMRATAFAVNILIIHLFGDAISPVVIGAIADATGPKGHANMNAGFLAVGGMILVGGLLWLWGTRYLQEDTERAPTRMDEVSDGTASV